MESATSLARGDFAFSEFELVETSQYVYGLYCERCRGAGNSSEKKPSRQRCPDGDGRRPRVDDWRR